MLKTESRYIGSRYFSENPQSRYWL